VFLNHLPKYAIRAMQPGNVPQIHVNEPAVRQTLSGGNKKSHACYRHGFSPNMINRYEILTFLPAFSFSLGIEIVNTPFS
jgi:hypothetical protein